MKQRSVLERLIGKSLPWVAWAWGTLALVWIILAIIGPSGFHTFMAIAWTILAALQVGSAFSARRQERSRARDEGEHSAAS
jgi:membrane protein implicated in regulation of membrane protease activity